MKQSKRSLTLHRLWPAIMASSLPVVSLISIWGGTGRWLQLFKIEVLLGAMLLSLWTSVPFWLMYALSNRISSVRRAFYLATIPSLILTTGFWIWTVRGSYLYNVQNIQDDGESGLVVAYALFLLPGCILILMLLAVLLTLPFQSKGQS